MDKKKVGLLQEEAGERREELMKTIARTEKNRQADDDPTVDLRTRPRTRIRKSSFRDDESDRVILNKIEAALKRIAGDDYGVCANCRKATAENGWKRCLGKTLHCCQERPKRGSCYTSHVVS